MSPDMLEEGKHSRMVDFYSLGALMYELLVGLPPNYNEDKNIMYYNIINEDPKFPSHLSEAAVNLLSGLLQKNPKERLGYRKEFKEVKSHAFFQEVNWHKVLTKDSSLGISPIRPKLSNSYFDPNFVINLEGN